MGYKEAFKSLRILNTCQVSRILGLRNELKWHYQLAQENR